MVGFAVVGAGAAGLQRAGYTKDGNAGFNIISYQVCIAFDGLRAGQVLPGRDDLVRNARGVGFRRFPRDPTTNIGAADCTHSHL